VLYIDQPVGTGYDLIYNDTVLQTQNIPNGDDLTKLMITFFNFHPPIHKTDVYFYAEGFAGKNMVELSYQLDVAIREQRIAMNFKGIILAGPWISSSDIIGGYPEFLASKVGTKIIKFWRAVYSVRGLERSELGGSHGCPRRLWTDFYDRSILRPKHLAYYRSSRPVIKIGPKGALGSYEIRPIHSAPSLGQSIDLYLK